jgi:hypothetical protein
MKVGSETDIPQISKSCGGQRLECRPIVIHIADRAHCLRRAPDGSAVSHRCVIVMSAANYPGPLFIDRSSVTRQAKRASAD